MSKSRIRAFRRLARIERERERKKGKRTAFSLQSRSRNRVYRRENVRVTRVAYRPYHFVSRRDPIFVVITRMPCRMHAKSKPGVFQRIIVKLSTILACRGVTCEMTRTNPTENGSGGVVTPTKKSLVRIGKYQMLRPIGKGNFARVEEAIHTVLGVKVSVINSNRRREQAAVTEAGLREASCNLDA